jgi:hypothetical protein
MAMKPRYLAMLSLAVFVCLGYHLSFAQTGPPGTTFCANENAVCSFSGTKTVYYGAAGKFFSGSFTNSVSCTNAVFGDPIYGTAKACFVPSAPATASLSANPTSISQGQSSVLTWGSTNATSCTGTNFTTSGTSGTASVTPSATTNYSVNCSGATASATVTVTPTSPPVLVTTLDGSPLAGPDKSDCQVYQDSAGTKSIQCPVKSFVSAGAHTVACSEWSGLLVASGGGTVQFTLPSSVPCRAPFPSVEFSTDGNTSFTVTTQSPAKMSGPSPNLIVNGVISLAPGASGWALFDGVNYNVGFR